MPHKDIEKAKKYREKYYKENKEREKNQSKDYYQNHKEELKKWARNYYNTHRKKYLDDIKRKHDALKKEILLILGNKCSNPNCLIVGGCKDWRCLQIDHINSNGPKERRRFNSPWANYHFILEQIKAGSKDYQLLCANCNWIKRYEMDENSHWRK